MKIRVPASTANFGPGFDAVGCALKLYLELEISQDKSGPHSSIQYTGESSEQVPLDHSNLILRSANYFYQRIQLGLDQSAAQKAVRAQIDESKGAAGPLILNYLPRPVSIKVTNEIPLSRGLGSSATAIVAAALLAQTSWGWSITRAHLFDYILELENHPDNVGATLFGSLFVGYVRSQTELDMMSHSTSPQRSGYLNLPWNNRIKAVCVVPPFSLSTESARNVLPREYSRHECVHNVQRLAVLVAALSAPQTPSNETHDPWLIYGALSDRLHQPYRAPLIPGMARMLDELTPASVDGLLGVVLSGAVRVIICFMMFEWD